MKSEILRIRCDADTLRQFKIVAVDYENYEKTVLALMKAYKALNLPEAKYRVNL